MLSMTLVLVQFHKNFIFADEIEWYCMKMCKKYCQLKWFHFTISFWLHSFYFLFSAWLFSNICYFIVAIAIYCCYILPFDSMNKYSSVFNIISRLENIMSFLFTIFVTFLRFVVFIFSEVSSNEKKNLNYDNLKCMAIQYITYIAHKLHKVSNITSTWKQNKTLKRTTILLSIMINVLSSQLHLLFS